MAAELDCCRLEVVLLPAKRGPGCIRCVMSENPDWYRRLCAKYVSGRQRGRKVDTIIRRRETMKSLLRLASGYVKTLYDHRLLPIIESEYDHDRPPF